jgi:hypothetical protein
VERFADDRKAFVGRVRSRSICGFNASDISNNVRRCERTQRDIRLDGVDHFYAVSQIAGRSTIIQGDQAAPLAAGDVTTSGAPMRDVTWHSAPDRMDASA